MTLGSGEHEAPQVYCYFRRYRCGILAPAAPPSSRWPHWCCCRGGPACRLAVGCIQRHVQASQIAEARDRAKARCASAPDLQPHQGTTRQNWPPWGRSPCPLRYLNQLQPRAIPPTSGSSSMSDIPPNRRSTTERPQRRRVCLQSAPCAADGGEVEGRRFCRGPKLLRTEGKARPSLAKRVATANDWHADIVPVDPP